MAPVGTFRRTGTIVVPAERRVVLVRSVAVARVRCPVAVDLLIAVVRVGIWRRMIATAEVVGMHVHRAKPVCRGRAPCLVVPA